MVQSTIHKSLLRLCCVFSFIALTGCSGLGMFNGYTWTQRGEYKIITRNDDLYLERLDGSDSKRLTHTPDKISSSARYVVDGKYIVYGEANSNQFSSKYYIIPAEGDDAQKKEITEQEFLGFR